eukprot:367758-Hanusia_phi.AAC.5
MGFHVHSSSSHLLSYLPPSSPPLPPDLRCYLLGLHRRGPTHETKITAGSGGLESRSPSPGRSPAARPGPGAASSLADSLGAPRGACRGRSGSATRLRFRTSPHDSNGPRITCL